MNKKATVFLPLFSIALLVLLVMLVFVISNHNDKRERENVEAVGYPALSLLKVYEEGEKASLFVEKASSFASKNAEIELGKNGGVSEDAKCEKTAEGVVIWTSCQGEFNVEKAYRTRFDKNLNNFLKNYKSTYSVFEDASALRNLAVRNGLLPQEYGLPLVNEYTSLVKNIRVNSLKQKNRELIIIFDPLNFPIEAASKESVYTIPIIVKSKAPELEIYREVYNQVAGCLPPFEQFLNEKECQSQIANKLPGIKFENKEGFVLVYYKEIRFAVDPHRNLPPLALRVI